jgi:hypothetical protein
VKTGLFLNNGISVLPLFVRFKRKVENGEIKCEKFAASNFLEFSLIHFVFSGDYLASKYELTSTPYRSFSIA